MFGEGELRQQALQPLTSHARSVMWQLERQSANSLHRSAGQRNPSSQAISFQ